jgi:hypothetical protein
MFGLLTNIRRSGRNIGTVRRKEAREMADPALVTDNPLVKKVAERLHFIDYFYEQRPVAFDWNDLTQLQRNKYLIYALQLLKIWEGK